MVATPTGRIWRTDGAFPPSPSSTAAGGLTPDEHPATSDAAAPACTTSQVFTPSTSSRRLPTSAEDTVTVLYEATWTGNSSVKRASVLARCVVLGWRRTRAAGWELRADTFDARAPPVGRLPVAGRRLADRVSLSTEADRGLGGDKSTSCNLLDLGWPLKTAELMLRFCPRWRLRRCPEITRPTAGRWLRR